MSGTNPVGTYAQSNYATQTGTGYPLQIDSNWAVAQRFVQAFAPHAAATPNMTVVIDPGMVFSPTAGTLTEVAQQTTTSFAAPSLLPRIDRIVGDEGTGIYSIVTGSENASPTPPALPANKFPIAQVRLQTTSTAISNSMITDERALWGIGTGGGFQAQATISSAATTDLGAAGSNNVFIAGTTTIGSFGSSASAAAPIFIVRFAGALTLTNSSHLLLPGGSNQITANNDSLLAQYLGSGNWQVLAYWSSVATAVPTGSITAYAGSSAPSGYLLCQGQSVSTTTYANLFAVTGYAYGGSGANFTIPDLRGRTIFGFDTSNATGRLTAAASGGLSASTLGNSGGEQAHTLTTAELANHSHTQRNFSTVGVNQGGAYGITVAGTLPGSTTTTGNDNGHNTVPPGLIANYIIKI